MACSWPLMSARSTPPETAALTGSDADPRRPVGSPDRGSIGSSPRRCATSWAKWPTAITVTPSTSAASSASAAGTNTVSKPSCLATATIGRMPFVCLTPPSSESSPRNRDASGIDGTCPELSSTARAIGRSYAGPAFRRSAGARLAVMRRIGNSQPEFLIAARARSRASCTAASGRPTTVNVGRPGEMSTSTSTITPSRPTTAHVIDLASIETSERAEPSQDGAAVWCVGVIGASNAAPSRGANRRAR